MKLPAWVVTVMAVTMLGGGWLAAAAFTVSSNGLWLAASVLGFGGGVFLIRGSVRGRRLEAAPPLPLSHPDHSSQRPRVNGASLNVPAAVRLGEAFPVRAMRFLQKQLPLNQHRQWLRFVIEEKWDFGSDAPERSVIVHEEELAVTVPLDTVGLWEMSWTARVPRHAPPSCAGKCFRLHAWVEFSVPYGMFDGFSAREPVVILPELAP